MISECIKRIRKEHKLTQKDIADALGIDRSTYTFYETGKTSPSIKTLHKLSDIYNVSIGYLVGYEENHPELRTKHVSTTVSMPDVDPIAYLSKEEQLLILKFRIISDDKKQELMKYVKNITVDEN